MKNKTGQTGMEFLITSGLLLFLFTVFFIAIQTDTMEKREDRERKSVRNLAYNIKEEINIASQASNGYKREFKIPNQISGQDYSVNIIDKSLYMEAEKTALSLKIEKVYGNITNGNNLIKKENDKIYINQ